MVSKMEGLVSYPLFKRRTGIKRLGRRLPYGMLADEAPETPSSVSNTTPSVFVNLEQHLDQEKRKDNATAGVQRLPMELINLILDLTIPSFSPSQLNWTGSFSQHFWLMSVCPLWRTMLESLPRLRASNSFPKWLVRKSLRLSQSQSLSVQITAFKANTSAQSEQLARYTTIILRHAARIQNLALQSHRPQDFPLFREIETPRLEMVVAWNQEADLRIAPYLTPKTVDQLRDLYVSGCRLQWQSGAPMQLHNFTMIGRYVISTEEIVDILIRNPGLFGLLLRNLLPPSPSTEDGIIVIPLPFLRSASIYNVNILFCRSILPRLQLSAGVLLRAIFDTYIGENIYDARFMKSPINVGLTPQCVFLHMKSEPSSPSLLAWKLRVTWLKTPRTLAAPNNPAYALRVCSTGSCLALGKLLGANVVS